MTDKPAIPSTVGGCRVLSAFETTPVWDLTPEWIVLCEWGKNSDYDRYVTWRVGTDGVGHSGHYHTSYRNAVNDFAQRAGILAEVNQQIKTLEDMVRARDTVIDDLTDQLSEVLARWA